MNNKKEISFGAFDSELMHQEIFIPEGFEATIDGDKIILTRKDSEDERIRKELIGYIVKEVGLYPGEDRKEHKWLRWLEKQGEQKPVEKVEPKFKVGDKIIKFSKTPCPVHSSTDDTICKVAEVHDTCYILNTKEGRIQVPFEWQDHYELVGQKPAWSEEDEVKINRIVACLENLKVADNDILLKDVDWLKSLKERYTWKPSDAQMEALKQAKTDACGKPYFNALASLYVNLH